MAVDKRELGPQWKKIVRVGLVPGVADWPTYERRFLVNMRKARILAVSDARAVPSPDYVRLIHKTIFKDVYLSAGQFRQPGETAVFDHGVCGADAHRIDMELTRLQVEIKAKLAEADEHKKALCVAEYLGRLRKIHPFKDGNTRTSAILMESQCNALFGANLRPEVSTENFKELLRNAYRGNLVLLANRILAAEKLSSISENTKVEIGTHGFDTDIETEWKHIRERIRLQQMQGRKGIKI
jgi:fido (protein-threonine AMPylation protein)